MNGMKGSDEHVFALSVDAGHKGPDYGPEFMRRSAALFNEIPEELLHKLEIDNRFPQGFTQKIGAAAEFFDEKDVRPLPDNKSDAYNNLSAFLSHPLVRQKVFTLLSIRLVKENRLGPTVGEIEEKMAGADAVTETTAFDAAKLIDVFKRETKSISKKDQGELRVGSEEDQNKRRLEYVKANIVRKMHIPADVDSGLYATYQWFREGVGKEFLASHLKEVATILAKAVLESDLPDVQKRYLAEYILPLTHQKPREFNDREYLMQLRNAALVLETYKMHSIRVREEEGPVQSKVTSESHIAADAGAVFIQHTKAFFAPMDKKKNGNPALPPRLAGEFDFIRDAKGKPTARNVVAALKGKIGGKTGATYGMTAEAIPTDGAGVDALIKKRMSPEQKEISLDFISLERLKDSDYTAEFESLLADSGMKKVDIERCKIRLQAYQQFYARTTKLKGEAARAQSVIAESTKMRSDLAGQKELRKEDSDDIKKRYAALKSFLDGGNRLLKNIDGHVSNSAREYSKQRDKNAALASIIDIFQQAYKDAGSGFAQLREDVRGSLANAQTEMLQTRNAFSTLWEKSGLRGQRKALREAVRRRPELNLFWRQISADKKLRIPSYPEKHKDRTEDQQNRIDFYSSILKTITKRIDDMKGEKKRRIGPQHVENVEAVQGYIQKYIMQPILDAEPATFVNPDEAEKIRRQAALSKKLAKEVDDLIEQLRAKMQ